MLVVQHEVLSAFSLQTSLGFLLKAKRFLVAVSVRNLEAVLRIFWELGPRNRAPNLFSLGCLPLSRSACVPYVEWFWVGSYISLFLFLCLLLVETKGGRYISVTGGCSCQDYSLTCCVVFFFFSFYSFSWNLKSSSECRVALALVLRNSFRFGWEQSCCKVLVEAFFVLLLIIISFPLARDR